MDVVLTEKVQQTNGEPADHPPIIFTLEAVAYQMCDLYWSIYRQLLYCRYSVAQVNILIEQDKILVH